MLRLDQPSDAGPDDPFEPLQIPDRLPSALDQMVNRERLERVTCAMASLDPRHRQAILLHLEGLPHAEIAPQLGAPVNTVRTWIFRGRACLTRLTV